MEYPILVNIAIPFRDKEGKVKEDIATAILDFHYKNIASIVRTTDGMSHYEYYNGINSVKVLHPFEEAMRIYEEQQEIDDRYKEEVRSFAKDNYNGIIDNYYNDDED